MKTVALTARCAAAAAAALLAVSLMAVPALAAPEDAAPAADGAAAPADPTTYTVRLYAGNRGLVNDGASFEWTGVPYGSDLELTGARVTVTDPKYYVKGIRPAGLDNVKDVRYVGQVDDRGFATGSVRVTEDADYVLAYGIMANRVGYTVRYVDAEGFTIAPSATYFGDVGDTPATTAVYVEGYVPDAYEISKTLGEDEADNVITFTYTRVAAGFTTEPDGNSGTVVVTPEGERVPARQPAAEAPAQGAGAAAGEGAGNEEEAVADEPTPLTTADGAEIIDDDGNPLMAPRDSMNIDDEAVPLAAAGFGEGGEAPEGPGFALAVSPTSVALLAGGVLLLVAAFILWRRRRKAAQEG